jgi:hypothetical protein
MVAGSSAKGINTRLILDDPEPPTYLQQKRPSEMMVFFVVQFS